MTWKVCKQFSRSFGKMTPYVKICKILFSKLSPPHRSTLLLKCRKMFPTVNRRNRALFTGPKINKISAPSQNVTTARIAPKVCHIASPQHLAHNVPNFIEIGSLAAEL